MWQSGKIQLRAVKPFAHILTQNKQKTSSKMSQNGEFSVSNIEKQENGHRDI